MATDRFYVDKAERAITSRRRQALHDAAEQLLDRHIRPLVPRASGALAENGHVETRGSSAAIVFDLEYAVRIHEDTNEHHRVGTDHFITKGAAAGRNDILAELAQHLRF